MKRTVVLLILLAAISWPTAAQVDKPNKGGGYGMFRIGACQHGYALFGGGLGGDAIVWRGLPGGVSRRGRISIIRASNLMHGRSHS